METTNRSTVEEIIEKSGDQGDEPRIVKIVQFTNNFGGISWGLLRESDDPARYDKQQDAATIWELAQEHEHKFKRDSASRRQCTLCGEIQMRKEVWVKVDTVGQMAQVMSGGDVP